LFLNTVRGVNKSAEVFVQTLPPSFQDEKTRTGDHQTLACLANFQRRFATLGRFHECFGILLIITGRFWGLMGSSDFKTAQVHSLVLFPKVML
jgi:hypothetical protein